MKMYTQKYNRGKGNVSNIPNTIAYTFIRNYMTTDIRSSGIDSKC